MRLQCVRLQTTALRLRRRFVCRGGLDVVSAVEGGQASNIAKVELLRATPQQPTYQGSCCGSGTHGPSVSVQQVRGESRRRCYRPPPCRIEKTSTVELPCVLAVPQINKKSGIAQAQQSLAGFGGTADEHGIFGKAGFGIADSVEPQRAPVHESAPMHVAHEHPAMNCLRSGPESSIRHLQHVAVDESGKIVRVGQQRLQLGSQALRRVPIIVVPVRDKKSARLFTSDIPFGSDTQPPIEANVAYLRIALQKISDGIGPVVNHDEFTVGIGLRLETRE